MEQANGTEYQKTPEFSLREAQFMLDLLNQIQHPPGNDIRISAFASAALQEEQEGELREIVAFALNIRRSITSSRLAALTLRGFQAQLLGQPGYPELFTTSDRWQPSIQDITNDFYSSGELLLTLVNREIQSNIAERYKSEKLILWLFRPYFAQYPNLLDIGCSQNHGLIQLHLNQIFPYHRTEVHDVVGIDEEGVPITKINQLDTTFVKRMLQEFLKIGPSVGIDIEKMNPSNRKWAKSCSFYPSELLDEEKVSQYDKLDNAIPQGLNFFPGDISNFDDESFKSRFGDNKFDIATMITMQYMQDPEEREPSRQKALEYVKPGGLLVVQDFCYLDGDGNLDFYKNIYGRPFTYRTFVIPKACPDRKILLFTFENGRCDKMIVNWPGVEKLGTLLNK